MTEQFEKEQIDFEFFDAVLVEGTDPKEIAKAEGLTLGRFAQHLTRGELGCYFSHRRLWQALLDSDDEAYVIFEDDMRLDSGFKAITESVLDPKWEFDIVRLGPLREHERSYLYADIGTGRGVYWTKRTALGMGSYTITRAAARALLASTKKIVAPVDFDVDRCWVHGQKVQLVYPAPAQQMPLISTIGVRVEDGDRRIGFLEKWYRRFTKHRYRLCVTRQRHRSKAFPAKETTA